MIIYSAKSDKVPLNSESWNYLNNFKKIKKYNPSFIEVNGECSSIKDWHVMDDIHNTYNILVDFNNALEKGNDIKTFNDLNDKLDSHTEIKNSIDYKCREYYDKMYFWYNLYIAYPTDKTYTRICNEIQDLLKYLAKQKIVKVSGCNLKRNFY